MLSWRKIARILLLIVSLLFVLAVSEVQAKTGSYTIKFGSGTTVAPTGTQVRVTAKAEDGTEYDQTFTFGGGETEEQMRNVIRTDLAGAGWDVQDNQTNGIIITGHGTSPIKQVDIGDNQRKVDTNVDGNCTLAGCKPGDRNFRFVCSGPNADSTYPGTIAVKLNAINATAPLVAGDGSVEAAISLETGLTNAGFMVTRTDSVVTLDWEHLTNLAALGDLAEIDMELTGGQGGPHLTLEVPDVASPAAIPTMSSWGIVIGALALLVLATYMIARKRRTGSG